MEQKTNVNDIKSFSTLGLIENARDSFLGSIKILTITSDLNHNFEQCTNLSSKYIFSDCLRLTNTKQCATTLQITTSHDEPI